MAPISQKCEGVGPSTRIDFEVLQETDQSLENPLTESGMSEKNPPSTSRPRARTEFQFMWDSIDGFIDATRSRRNSVRSSEFQVPDSHHISNPIPVRPATPYHPPHGRTESQASTLIQTGAPPPVPPKAETPTRGLSRKGELKSSFKAVFSRSTRTEKSALPEIPKTSPVTLDCLARKDSLKGSASGSFHVRKDTISAPEPLDPCSLMPQTDSSSLLNMEPAALARYQSAPPPLPPPPPPPPPSSQPPMSNSGKPTQILRKPAFGAALGQEKDRQVALQASPKHVVQFGQRQVSQRSVQAVTQTSRAASVKEDMTVPSQVYRGASDSRTTQFGDFMSFASQTAENDPLPTLRGVWKRRTRRSTQPAGEINPPAQQLISSELTSSEPLQHEKPWAQELDTQRGRKLIESAWIADASSCTLDEPLALEPCRSCELPFDGGSNTQLTCKGQLCGDCIKKQPRCLSCGKTPFSAMSELTQHGIWCKECADTLPYPCDFCGKEVARMYQKQTETGLMCWECVGAETPQEIGPGADWPRARQCSDASPPILPLKSPHRRSISLSEQSSHNRPINQHRGSTQWPERSASLKPLSEGPKLSAIQGVDSSISPVILRKDHSPLSMLKQNLGSDVEHQDEDLISDIAEDWQTDVPSDDETVSKLSNRTERQARQTFALIPKPRVQSPFTPDLKRAVSSVYPDDEPAAYQADDMPPLPRLQLMYQEKKANAYGIAPTPFEEDHVLKAESQQDNAVSNVDKRTTVMSIIDSYLLYQQQGIAP